MAPRADLTGKRFGKLTALWTYPRGREPRKTTTTSRWWRCACDCGNISDATVGALRSGEVKSCGCLASIKVFKESGLRAAISRGNKGGFTSELTEYKRNAKNRNLSWDLSSESATILMRSDCFYCGSAPGIKPRAKSLNFIGLRNGIDRLDPSLGYSSENCVACCSSCNVSKSDKTFDEFISMCIRVSLIHSAVVNEPFCAQEKWSVM